MKHLIEDPITRSTVYKGSYLEYHLDHVRLPNGKEATREYLHHPGAVAAVPVMENGDVLLVKQFRYPTGVVLLEIPAGKLEPGEDPDEAIRRELAEEIGYRPAKLELLLSTWTTPGFSDEIIHLYAASELVPAPGESDSDEFLDVIRMSKTELLRTLRQEKLVDAKTMLAVAMMQSRGLW